MKCYKIKSVFQIFCFIFPIFPSALWGPPNWKSLVHSHFIIEHLQNAIAILGQSSPDYLTYAEMKTCWKHAALLKMKTHLSESCSMVADVAVPCASRRRWHLGGRAAQQTLPIPGTSSCSTVSWEPAPMRTALDRSTGRKPWRTNPTHRYTETYVRICRKTAHMGQKQVTQTYRN